MVLKKKKVSKLNNLEISRDILLDNKTIKECYDMINLLRKKYSSNLLTCLHENSLEKQKFPCINMFRQILKENNFTMKPMVESNGYCPLSGKKNVIRTFVITQNKI